MVHMTTYGLHAHSSTSPRKSKPKISATADMRAAFKAAQVSAPLKVSQHSPTSPTCATSTTTNLMQY
jgi:hypothetical protein